MKEERLIVQFTHPGGEHKPERGKNFKSWNTNGHKRKFMLANGDFVQNNKLFENKPLMFWGEWEPDSEIIATYNAKNTEFPSYLHKPVLTTYPNHSRQNTDPYVFNKQFYYFCCKQTKQSKITQLARLAKGSIILFGSTKNQNSTEAYFAIDTVFVVSNYIEFIPKDFNDLKGKVDSDFFEISIKSAYHKFDDEATATNCTINGANLKNKDCGACQNIYIDKIDDKIRCYIGATYDKPYEGMYSFVPAKLGENLITGFERLKLKKEILDIISNNLNAAPSLNKEHTNFYEVWQTIKELSQSEGLVEGFNFKFTKK